MIRLILVVITITLYLLIGIPISGVLILVGKKNPDGARKVSTAMIRWLFRVFLFLSGIRLDVKGYENVPKDQPVLFISNHEGIFDVISLYPYTYGLCGIVAKQELAKIPLFSTWCRLIGCWFLDRQNVKEGMKVILGCIDDVKNGKSIMIYPEGTRNKTPEQGLLDFKDGSFKIAQKSGCLIVPVAIRHTGEVFENHAPFIHGHKVPLRFGTPVNMKELDPEDRKHIGTYMQGVVAGLLAEIDAEEAAATQG